MQMSMPLLLLLLLPSVCCCHLLSLLNGQQVKKVGNKPNETKKTNNILFLQTAFNLKVDCVGTLEINETDVAEGCIVDGRGDHVDSNVKKMKQNGYETE